MDDDMEMPDDSSQEETEDGLSEGQRIEIMKATERLNSIGDRLVETCPHVDKRVLDAIFIAASLLEQQMMEDRTYEMTMDGPHGETDQPIKPKEVQKGPAHNMPFSFLDNNEKDDTNPPSVDDLNKWFDV